MPTRPLSPILLAPATLLVLLLAGCGGGGGGGSAATPTPPPPVVSCPIATVPTTPSWSTHIYPFIQQSCGTSSTSCHDNPGGSRINLHQSSAALYAALVDKPTPALTGWFYIKSGDDLTAPNRRSWLYEKVDPIVPGAPGQAATGAAIGTPMPAGSSLCAPTVNTLKAWIIAGAPNN